MKSHLIFYGGVGTVTGANFLLDTGSEKLLVDCGSFQGVHDVCDTINAAPFPYEPSSIDALFITHAHQDHIGRVPKLVREGFRGTIYSTPATKDLSAVMFDDALGIMDDHAKRHGCDPLYSAGDVAQALAQWEVHEYHEPFKQGDATVEFFDAGHILGSTLVKFSRGSRSILFTGDLGNTPEPLLVDTEAAGAAKGVGPQYLVMESVYGDRVHEGREGRKEFLRRVIEEVRARKGVLLIPSFSIERTQVLLYELNSMVEAGEMQPLPIYLDSPLAHRVTDVFRKYTALFNTLAQEQLNEDDDLFSFPGLEITKNTGESRTIHEKANPKIIIAGAGMSVGGRIRAHEMRYLPEKSTTVLFVGYQVPGSLGRRIQDGAKSVQIDGQHIRIRARIEHLGGYSGHADREQLLDFVEGVGDELEKIFVVMGEPKASLYLAQRIREYLDIDAIVPKESDRVELDW